MLVSNVVLSKDICYILTLNMVFSVQVDAPSAYVCAESRIYDATEWYICQVRSITVSFKFMHLKSLFAF